MIDEEGNQVGIISNREALEKAYEKGLDLVEVSPKSNPPVCKIMDYGKYKYKKEIAEKERKKNQTQIVVKEIKLRPKIDTNDLKTKKNHVKRFLKNSNKVKITIMFRGREIVHKDIARELMDKILEDMEDKCVVEQPPKMEGYNMTMLLGPSS